jgi:hypothetical protein
MEGFVGVTAIDVSTAAVTVTVVVPETPPAVAVIVAFPTALPVTRPWLPGALLTVASVGAEETQLTNAVRFWVVPSEKSPVAMSCSLVPSPIEELGGVIVIAVSTAAVTVTAVVPDTPPRVAVIVALPAAVPVTRPWLPGASLTVASDGAEESQVTNAVRFWVVPSEKSPVAMSCSLVPVAIEELGGVIVIAVSTADVTVTVVVPDTPPNVALIVALPAAVPVTTPRPGAVLLTAATDGAEETQVTNVVRFWVVPSEKSPVAMSCSLVPVAIEELGGVIVIAVSAAAVTVMLVVPDTPASVAVIVALPTPVPVTRPGLTVLATVAIVSDDEVQPAEAVRS